MNGWTGMHRHRWVGQIAYKIGISRAHVERKSSRAARRHRAKVLPKCETIITIACAVGERRAAVFPLFRAVMPLLCAAVFRAKSHARQRVSGKSREKRGLSAVRLRLRPRRLGQKHADVRGVAAAVCCKSAANAAKRAATGRRAIGPGAGSLWLQIGCKCSQTAPATGQLRGGNMPSMAIHSVKGKPVAVKIGFAVG